MVQFAHSAIRSHPHWKAKCENLEQRMKYQKAVVAIGRMMLVSIWHILTKREADRHAIPEKVARRFLQHVYDLGKENRPNDISTPKMVRIQLDRLGVGKELKTIRWSETRIIRLLE